MRAYWGVIMDDKQMTFCDLENARRKKKNRREEFSSIYGCSDTLGGLDSLDPASLSRRESGAPGSRYRNNAAHVSPAGMV